MKALHSTTDRTNEEKKLGITALFVNPTFCLSYLFHSVALWYYFATHVYAETCYFFPESWQHSTALSLKQCNAMQQLRWKKFIYSFFSSRSAPRRLILSMCMLCLSSFLFLCLFVFQSSLSPPSLLTLHALSLFCFLCSELLQKILHVFYPCSTRKGSSFCCII